MIIALIHTTGTYWLAGEVGVDQRVHSSAADLQFAGGAMMQSQQRVRAAVIALRDRGNLSASVSFTTSRQFSTIDDAEVFAATYDAGTPRAGTLRCYRESGAAVCQLDNAVVAPPTRQVIGVTVILNYSVSGGGWQALTPEGDLDPIVSMGGNAVTMAGFLTTMQ
jgi:hypothetical protein